MPSRIGMAMGIRPDEKIDLTPKVSSNKTHPLVIALSTGKSGDSLSILAREADHKYDFKRNILLDRGGNPMLPSKLLEEYFFTTDVINCPYCQNPIHTDAIFAHLQYSYAGGSHQFSHQRVIKFFSDHLDGTHDKMRWKANNS